MKETEVRYEQLEALKMMDNFKEILTIDNPNINDIALHLASKDCCMLAVKIVLGAHMVRGNKYDTAFWSSVKEEIELL